MRKLQAAEMTKAEMENCQENRGINNIAHQHCLRLFARNERKVFLRFGDRPLLRI